MRVSLLTCLLFLACYRSFSQQGFHCGISGLPVIDVMNLFPENQIGGFALMGNAGYFVTDKVSVGGNILYSRASNSYYMFEQNTNEKFHLLVVHATSRFYFQEPVRLRFYGMANLGIGLLRVEQSRYNVFSHGYFIWTDPAATFMAGAGLNYFFTEKVALDFNAAYGVLFTIGEIEPYFQSVLPTLGVQFFFNKKPKQ